MAGLLFLLMWKHFNALLKVSIFLYQNLSSQDINSFYSREFTFERPSVEAVSMWSSKLEVRKIACNQVFADHL